MCGWQRSFPGSPDLLTWEASPGGFLWPPQRAHKKVPKLEQSVNCGSMAGLDLGLSWKALHGFLGTPEKQEVQDRGAPVRATACGPGFSPRHHSPGLQRVVCSVGPKLTVGLGLRCHRGPSM